LKFSEESQVTLQIRLAGTPQTHQNLKKLLFLLTV